MSQLLDTLQKADKLSEDIVRETQAFISDNQTYKPESENGAKGDTQKEKKVNLSVLL